MLLPRASYLLLTLPDQVATILPFDRWKNQGWGTGMAFWVYGLYSYGHALKVSIFDLILCCPHLKTLGDFIIRGPHLYFVLGPPNCTAAPTLRDVECSLDFLPPRAASLGNCTLAC